MEFELCFSRTLELTEEGELILFFGIYVDYVELNGMNYEWLKSWTAPVGGVEVEEMLRKAATEAATHLQQAAAVFAEAVPE